MGLYSASKGEFSAQKPPKMERYAPPPPLYTPPPSPPTPTQEQQRPALVSGTNISPLIAAPGAVASSVTPGIGLSMDDEMRARAQRRAGGMTI